MQAKADSALDAAKKRSDVAWAKALPIIERDEKAGKPYVPWANKPSDLPQAKIPAFPGAEGGGMYTDRRPWRQGNCGDQFGRSRPGHIARSLRAGRRQDCGV
jgi:hypothetical protein